MIYRNKFLSTLAITALFFSLFAGCTKQIEEDSFRFVFMTDIHVQDENIGEPGFRKAIEKVNRLEPDFVLTGGDMIMDALGQSYDEAVNQYNVYTECIKDFEVPVYHTIGNHENFGVYKWSGVSTDHPLYGKEMYKEKLDLDETYYSFDHKNWHFIILDDIGFTENRRYYGNIDSLQIEWLKDDLQDVDKETPIVITAHIPLVSALYQITAGGTSAAPASLAVWNSNEVLALFEDYNLRLVLQGHLHMVEEIVEGDASFITGGAVSGDKWNGPKYIFPEGFVVVDVDGDNFDWNYETYGWEAGKTKK